MNTLNILVIDDYPENLTAAKEQLSGHNLTCVSSYEEAEKALVGDNHFFRRSVGEVPTGVYDVVITDLMMPASPKGQGKPENARGEVPYGLIFAILALRLRTSKVILLTDSNHHNSPLSWALDTLGSYDGYPYSIGESTVLFNSQGVLYDRERHESNRPLLKDYAAALKSVLKFSNE